jgi:hypothetical protein
MNRPLCELICFITIYYHRIQNNTWYILDLKSKLTLVNFACIIYVVICYCNTCTSYVIYFNFFQYRFLLTLVILFFSFTRLLWIPVSREWTSVHHCLPFFPFLLVIALSVRPSSIYCFWLQLGILFVKVSISIAFLLVPEKSYL